jgi:hypothetical protein
MAVLRRNLVPLKSLMLPIAPGSEIDLALRANYEKGALLGDSSPGPWECFGIIRERSDLVELMMLANRVKRSSAARQEFNRRIKQYVGVAAQRLKDWLSVRRGRPRDAKQQRVWLVARELREENPSKYSWGSLARKLTPAAYEKDRKLAADRIRDGVKRLGPSDIYMYGLSAETILSSLSRSGTVRPNPSDQDKAEKYPAVILPGVRMLRRRDE